jgi:hypothetical protein
MVFTCKENVTNALGDLNWSAKKILEQNPVLHNKHFKSHKVKMQC